MVSKAFEKSKKIPWVMALELKFVCSCSMRLLIAPVVFLPFLKLCWLSVNK